MSDRQETFWKEAVLHKQIPWRIAAEPRCPAVASYDELDGGIAAAQLGFPALRQQLLSVAHGSVLETAVGTGLNLPFYDTGAVTSLTAIDLSRGMLDRAGQRAARLGLANTVQLVQGDVERLQQLFDGRTFDTGGCGLKIYQMIPCFLQGFHP